MPSEIKFGTDGWRAIIADQFTFENVRVAAQGLAGEMLESGSAKAGAMIAWDTRFASERFAMATAEVLAGNGIRCLLATRPAPTPAASYSVIDHGAGGGVMITASHNPGSYNGFKVKSDQGGSAPPEMVARIEAEIERIESGGIPVRSITLDEAEKSGLLKRFDPTGPYLEQLARVVEVEPIRQARLKIVVDSMYGSGGGLFPRLLSGGNLELIEIHGEPNPAFPGFAQPEPIEANLGALQAAVREAGADAGLAFDGDADRLGLVDENGRYISTLEGFSLLAHHLLERRNERGAVVSTITMSSMVDRLGSAYGVDTPRTAVGFKFVGPRMLDSDAVIGGEESGGYAFRGHVPERDGLLSGLVFLEAMVSSGKSPSELLGDLFSVTGPHSFRRIDVEFPEEERTGLQHLIETAEPASLGGMGVERSDRLDGVKYFLSDGGWGIVRMSGTEPLMRMYAEAPDAEGVDHILRDLSATLGLRQRA
ncbi:MAG: phosphoglucomutase/phosphomannomutase family protein [Dehalococcoidia bacterium]|jgi:phosphomannomutase|nr:phosphoglucomutase/phosphomannomutase family protein [Dehalococcoidia bacterium]